MKSCLFLNRVALLSAFILTSSILPTFGADVAWEGYFRTRYNLFYNIDLDRDATPKLRQFNDLRFRLNPTFFVSDKVRVRTSLNFFDGVLGDNPFRATTYGNPATTQNRLIDSDENNAVVGGGINTRTSMGGVAAPEGYSDTSDLTPLQLRRIWGEFDLPYGTIKVGRMPVHLGMGIYANAGDETHQEVGTTRDRIMFDTSFGPYYVRPGLSWRSEGSLDNGGDDYIEYFFHFGRMTDVQEVGLYLSYNSQNKSTSTTEGGSADTTSADAANLKSSYWAFDFYVQQKFEPVNLQAEILLVSGKYAGKNIMAINSAARAEFTLSPKTKFMIEPGYSSGTSESDLAAGDIKSMAFNRDYNVSLLVFEEALPGGLYTKDSTGTVTSSATATSPHAGAIANAFYGRLRLDYDATSFFKPSINVVMPVAATKTNEMAGRWYGVEYDIMTTWPMDKYWSAYLDWGHFIPNKAYERISSGHSVILMRGGITATF